MARSRKTTPTAAPIRRVELLSVVAWSGAAEDGRRAGGGRGCWGIGGAFGGAFGGGRGAVVVVELVVGGARERYCVQYPSGSLCFYLKRKPLF